MITWTKGKFSGVLFLLVVISACYMNYAERLAFTPEAPDKACIRMASVLEGLEYTVTKKNEAPDRYITSKPYVWAEKSIKEPEGKIKATIEFAQNQGETQISIRVDWIGKAQIKDQILKDATAEISEAFEKTAK